MKATLFVSKSLVVSVCVLFTFYSAFADNSVTAPKGYSIETISLPENTKMNIAGLDVASNGDVYAATRLGEVWVLKGGADISNTTPIWRRFADGLHEVTGLLVDGDSIMVAQKPELTRLVDTNSDDVAEQYLRVVKGWKFHNNYHEYHYGPVKDNEGNYYAALNLAHGGKTNLAMMGSDGGWRGWMYQVNTKGEFVPYASGLRSPAGIGISPSQELFFTDNQGDWIATSKLHFVEKGKFYGHPASLIDHPDYSFDKVHNMTAGDFAALAEPPTVWFPHREVANSPGNPVWDTTGGQFGPFAGQMFIPDYTFSSIFRVMLDKVNGQYQGAAMNFMDGFQSGNIRIQFDDNGQLWVGQTARGWPTRGNKPFGLQKVVWNGEQAFELQNIKLTRAGFSLTFTDTIDETSVVPDAFSIHQWRYRYSKEYGSPKLDEQIIEVTDTVLSEDKKTINISLPLTPNRVLSIAFDGIAANSQQTPSTTELFYTLNQVIH